MAGRIASAGATARMITDAALVPSWSATNRAAGDGHHGHITWQRLACDAISYAPGCRVPVVGCIQAVNMFNSDDTPNPPCSGGAPSPGALGDSAVRRVGVFMVSVHFGGRAPARAEPRWSY